jgi:hypothetical protein
MQIELTKLRNLIIQSLIDVSAEDNPYLPESSFQDYGIVDEFGENLFKERLIHQTWQLLSIYAALTNEKIEYVVERLRNELKIEHDESLLSFENRYMNAVNSALDGDVNKDKNPRR